MRFLLLLVFLAGCTATPKSPVTMLSGSFASIPYRITLGTSLDKRQKKAVQKNIETVFALIDCHCNDWNPLSEIGRINAMPPLEKREFSVTLAPLLLAADYAYTLSEGRFDPTVKSLALLWKEHLKKGSVPQSDCVVGWHHIHIEGNTLWKDADVALDLGALVKGYAVDLIADGLQELGFDSFCIEWGGEVKTAGLHPEGRKWSISLGGKRTIELAGAVATSGDAYQCWTVGDRVYTHIIDPKTRLPLERGEIAQVSVEAKTCLEADAMATVLMLFPTVEESVAWAKTHLPDCTCTLFSH